MLILFRLVQIISLIPIVLSMQVEIYKIEAKATSDQIKAAVEHTKNMKFKTVDSNQQLMKINKKDISDINNTIHNELIKQIRELNERIDVLEKRNPTVTKTYGISIR